MGITPNKCKLHFFPMEIDLIKCLYLCRGIRCSQKGEVSTEDDGVHGKSRRAEEVCEGREDRYM